MDVVAAPNAQRIILFYCGKDSRQLPIASIRNTFKQFGRERFSILIMRSGLLLVKGLLIYNATVIPGFYKNKTYSNTQFDISTVTLSKNDS